MSRSREMGLLFRPIIITHKNLKLHSIGLVDSGAERTLLHPRVANYLSLESRATFEAYSITGHPIKGSTTEVTIQLPNEGVEALLEVGLTDVPFVEDLDIHGLEAILGVDYLQATQAKFDFTQ